jgi:hypothetical protein
MSDKTFLYVEGKTWTRDSHGLFDYESHGVKENILLIKDNTNIIRRKHEIKEKKEIEENSTDEYMCKVINENNKFSLHTNLERNMHPSEKNINDLQNKIWYIIKQEPNSNNQNQNPNIQNENEHFDLELNDVIKLGRVKYVITDLHMNGQLHNIEEVTNVSIFNLIMDYKTSILDKEIVCKYCLCHECGDDSPLLRLCVCSDSMSVHYSCVKRWISTNLTVKNNDKKTVISYNMKNFNCDICKTPYPRKFIIMFS